MPEVFGIAPLSITDYNYMHAAWMILILAQTNTDKGKENAKRNNWFKQQNPNFSVVFVKQGKLKTWARCIRYLLA